MTSTATRQQLQPVAAPAPVAWEWVDCCLCGADATEPYARERSDYFDKMLDFEIVRCRGCGLVYTNPRLADHNAIYRERTVDDAGALDRHAHAKRGVFKRALRRISRYGDGLRTGCLLDIGCGSGHFLTLAQERGYLPLGIEPAPVPARHARQRLGLKVIEADIQEVSLPAERFDVVTLWDVIEHVPDPSAVLRRAAELLRPGGVMALRFPSASWQRLKSEAFRLFGVRQRPAFAPTMHLTFFEADTFDKLAASLGLETVAVHITAAECNTGSWGWNVAKFFSAAALGGGGRLLGRRLGNLEVYCRKVQVV